MLGVTSEQQPILEIEMTANTAAPKKKTARKPRKVSQAELKRQIKALSEENKGLKLAKNHPVVKTGIVDTTDMELHQQNPREQRSIGDSRESLDAPSSDIIEKAPPWDKIEMLNFMEEELLVKVHQTTNEQEVPIPVVWNDGRAQYFIRGQSQKVKRKFVEILARCRVTTFAQEAFKDGAGNDSYRYVPNTGHLYPFSVLNDPSGARGSKWLEDIMSEEG